MKKLVRRFFLAFFLGYSIIALIPNAFAVSQDECAIWLCAPAGFPSGCGAAHSAMKSRLKDFKPPLPPFSACAVDANGNKAANTDGWSFTLRHVIKIAEHQTCVKWVTEYVNKDRDERVCRRYETVKAHVREGRSCYYKRGGNRDADYVRIEGCIGTARELKILENGKLIGEPYYF